MKKDEAMKKSSQKKMRSLIGKGVFLSLLSIGMFASCGENSGLGASVDVNPPTVSITYPETSSVIKEDFILAGTCEDDKDLASVKVSVRNVEASESSEKEETVWFDATLDAEKKNWSISLNAKTENENDFGLPIYTYPDGKYEISVKSFDASGKSSIVVSRTVEIDNTPPIFFITSPQIDDQSDMTNYGTKLKIAGTIADAHKVSTMKIVVYDEEGTVVADSENNPITVNNVTTAGGTSETIASYLNTTTTGNELNNNYINIYFADDLTRTGTRKYSCEITLVDEAQVYRTPSSTQESSREAAATTQVSLGNSISKLFAYYNIRDIVGSDDFDANKMMQVINGTYSGENLDKFKAALLAEGSSQSKAKFTLNPKANPTYSIIGFGYEKTLSATDETKTPWSESTVKAKFSVVATQGLNQDPIDKNSERAYLVGPFASQNSVGEFITANTELLDKLNTDMENLSDTYVYDSATDTDEAKAAHAAKNDEIWAKYLSDNAAWMEENKITLFEKLELSGDVSGSGESYTYPYTLPEELPSADSVYLFFATGRDKEGLGFTNGDNFYGFKLAVTGNKPTFKGVAFVKNDNTEDVISANGYSNLGNLSITGKATCDSGKIINIKYELKVTDESLTKDNAVCSFTNTVAYSEENQKFEQPFTFNLLEKASAEQKTTLLASGKRYLYTVDLTTNAQPGGEFQTQYIVHIDTKIPTIEITKADKVYTDTTGTTVKNWVGATGLSRLRGNIDEENPYEASYDIRKNGESLKTGELGGVYSFDMTNDEGEPLDEITLAAGDYLDVKFSATDKAGNKSEEFVTEKYYADVTKPTLVTADEQGDDTPKAIRIGGAIYNSENENSSWRKDTALLFEGWYKETESGISAIHYVINPTVDESDLASGEKIKEIATGAMGADSNGKFSSTISGFSPSGASKIYLAAEDNVGNISAPTSYVIKIDQVGPEFTEPDEGDRNLPANGTKDVSFEITVKDQENASGIDIEKVFDDGTKGVVVTAIYNGTQYPLSDSTVTVNNNEVTACDLSYVNSVLKGTIKKEYINGKHNSVDTDSNGTPKKQNIEFNGNVTIQITVYDTAKNSSTNQQFVLQVDGTAPTIAVTAPKLPTTANPTANDITWITGKTTINGTVTDIGVSGVDGAVGKFKWIVPNKTQQAGFNAATTPSARVSALSGATWNAFASEISANWSIDFQSSNLENESYTNATYGISNAKSFVYYAFKTTSDATLKDGKKGYPTTDAQFEYATYFDETNNPQYRKVPVYFLVTDLAGNQDVVESTFYVDVEKGRPTAKISYPKNKNSGESTEDWQKISEEVTLNGVATDNEAVKKIEVRELWYTTDDAATVKGKVNETSGSDSNTWTKVTSSDITIKTVDGVTPSSSVSTNSTYGGIVLTLTGSQLSGKGNDTVEAFDIEFSFNSSLIESLKNESPSKKITAIKVVIASYDENDYESVATRYAYVDTENPALVTQRIVRLADSDTLSTSAVTQIVGIENGFVKVSATESHTILVDRNYEANMWFSGLKDDGTVGAHWFYIATVTDDSVVEGIELKDSNGNFKYGKQEPSAKTTSYSFAIPIPVNKGNLSSNLYRYDGAHQDVFTAITLNIDNVAPQMYKTNDTLGAKATGSAGVYTAGGNLRLIGDGQLGDKYVIENSNGSFSMGDQVVESGSGLAFVSYWIERVGSTSGTGKLYNPIVKTASGFRFLPSSSSGYKTADYTSTGDIYVNSEGLPVLKVSNVAVGTENSKTIVTYSGFSGDTNTFINRPYGMVKINGGYYRIDAISGTKATLDSDLGLKGNTADVEFIYAGIIDHIGVETLEDSGSDYYTVAGDDGDGIAETLRAKGEVYTWAAVFDSLNLPDGPARIHVVSFDNAGNSSHAYVDTSVQNNRPRVAKLFVGTDFGFDSKFTFDTSAYASIANGNFDEVFGQKDSSKQRLNYAAYTSPAKEMKDGTEVGEFVFFSTLDSKGNASAIAEIADRGINANFVAKNDVLILPEIVGGEGTLQYIAKVSDAATSPTAETSATKAGTNYALKEFLTGTALSGKLEAQQNGTLPSGLPTRGIYYSKETLEKYESWTTTAKESRYFNFTIWDNTGSDELIQGTNTLWALFSVPIVVNVIDDEAPTATFDTLYWTSKEDSSTVYDSETNQPLGHVDTEEDLNATNPQVAGEVYLRGTVTDSTIVSEILIQQPSYSGEPTDPVTIATRGDDGYWHTGYYNGSTWMPTYFDGSYMQTDNTAESMTAPSWPTGWKGCEITYERKASQKDHEVKFKFQVDTTKYGVQTAQAYFVQGKDKKPNASGVENTIDQTTKNTPTARYNLDFVPYIQKITLSDGTEVSRSRLGRYPVRAGENIRIYGMNFKVGEVATVKFYETSKDATGTIQYDTNGSVKMGTVTTVSPNPSVTADGTNGNYVEVAAPSQSRFVSVTVESHETANNTNKNKKQNIEEGYLQKFVNTDQGLATASENGTNFWTDDRYIAVWNVETSFTGSINPHSGVIKKVTADNTDTSSHRLYVAETDGAGVSYEEQMQDTYFASISSDDMRVYTYDFGKASGTSMGNRYVFGQNNTDIFRGVPPDELDCTIIAGAPYYAVQQSWVGNVDANCWGPGLFMARIGWRFNQGELNADTTTANITNYHVIIEKQGASSEARNRNSSQGYDSVLKQFKNPRIAGWNNISERLEYNNNGDAYSDSTDYVYISYYDSYARCLKFAGYKAGHRVTDAKRLVEVSGYWGSELGKNADAHDLVKQVRTADNMDKGYAVVAGFDTLNNNPTQFKEEVGEWSDILVDPATKYPVIIYYNKTEKSLEVAVGKTYFPTHEGNVVKNGSAYNSATDHSEDGWMKYKGITPNSKADFGRYVSATMDASGNLHVAAQDATNAKLYYLFLEKTNNYKPKYTVIVDATSGAGRWTDIELTDASKSTPEGCKPVISYINTSYLGTTQGVKVAYLESVSETTLNFENMTDPAKWQAGDQRTSVLPDVKETKGASSKAIVGVGFNSDMLALDFLRGE